MVGLNTSLIVIRLMAKRHPTGRSKLFSNKILGSLLILAVAFMYVEGVELFAQVIVLAIGVILLIIK